MAELSLNSFKNRVKDVARPNRFWVSMDLQLNTALLDGFADNNEPLPTWDGKFEFLAKTASLPGRTVGNIELNWQGMKYNIAGDPTFDDITFTFINSYEFDLRSFFEGWINGIAQMETNERSQPGAYKTDSITMSQLGRTQNDILAVYSLNGAYPTTLAAVDLSMDNNDQVEEISVTFKFDTFTVR